VKVVQQTVMAILGAAAMMRLGVSDYDGGAASSLPLS
jgi:hypothetical protein